ncbi:MAG: chitobiase/beta-hexosaminidase C-terminal domain-containing protein [Draconibacterium sp.]|nr:chitobiase/beta-hexosaminidase C-terminal domain-containing protein [Draconibacterium sp.]
MRYTKWFYKNPFTVKLTADSPGETIKYTLDGSDPKTALNVLTGTSPVSVLIDPGSTTGGKGKTGGVVLRAAKYQEGFAPGIPTTRSYIFYCGCKNQTNLSGRKLANQQCEWSNY